MNIHKNARLTPLRREEMALAVIEGVFSKAHAARAYGVSAKIVARWVERYKAEGSKGMAHRRLAPPAADRQAHRHGSRRLARHRQPGSQARRAVAAQGHRAGRTDPTLRARASRRDDPHRHQEAWPLQPSRPSHHRRSTKG